MMFCKNFDIVAVLVVACGIAIMQGAPRFEQRVQAAAIRHQTAAAAGKCDLAGRILSRIAIRRAE